jgi:hypothetical protein
MSFSPEPVARVPKKSSRKSRKEKEAAADAAALSGPAAHSAPPTAAALHAAAVAAAEADQGAEPGPAAPMAAPAVSYGGALLAGEGEAIASYVQSGKRIPRRGEIGKSSEQIEHFETLGYVMSGSRNKRMTAVRLRKEQQVIGAEEKKVAVQQHMAQMQIRENKLLSDLRSLIEQQRKKNP